MKPKKNVTALPRVATVHDVSCIGRCAQTVILPMLSVLGVQACPLPTALLSTHTGGYEGFTFLDLTEEMDGIRKHWHTLGERFDAVYSGFLGSEKQIETVLSFVEECREANPGCLFLADPVMGDEGKKYKTYTDELCRLTGELVKEADIITPNLTEAYLLLEKPYREMPTEKELDGLLDGLKEMCRGTVFITGVRQGKRIGTVYADADGHKGSYFAVCDRNGYPGTGDVFASMVLAGILRGIPLGVTVEKTCEFIAEASAYTTALGTPVREGLAIEALLHELTLE